MKAFAAYFADGVRPLGSDTVFILDARNKPTTQVLDAKKQLEKLQAIKPWINGYAVYKGDFKSWKAVYRNNVTIEQANNW